MKKTILASLLLLASLAVQAKVYLVAVGVGMNDFVAAYGPQYENRYMANEAKAIVEVYQRHTDVEYRMLVDSLATRDSIIASMRELYSQADSSDIVVFFFSGHGYPGGFVVHDLVLFYADVRDAMARSRSHHKVMFTQACYAGGMEPENSTRTQRHYRNSDVMLFMSSHHDETSLTLSSQKYSLFTEYLIEALQGKADRNGDHVVTAGELFLYVKGNVAKRSNGEQRPRMWGNFPLDMPIIQLTDKE